MEMETEGRGAPEGGLRSGRSGLPGEHRVDDAFIDRIVKKINEMKGARNLELALEIGRYVRSALFDGDARHFASRQSGHLTFKALARRPDLDLSYTYLVHAVRVLEQVERLGPDLSAQLGWCHHRALLRVRSVRQKGELARRAAAENWSVRKLGERIDAIEQQARGDSARLGRPCTPGVVKAVRGALAALDRFDPVELDDPETLRRLAREDFGALIEEATAAEERIARLVRALRAIHDRGSPPDA